MSQRTPLFVRIIVIGLVVVAAVAALTLGLYLGFFLWLGSVIK